MNTPRICPANPLHHVMLAVAVSALLLVAAGCRDSSGGPRLDLALMVDTSADSADVVRALQDTLPDTVAAVSAGRPAPSVRAGLVLYGGARYGRPVRVVPLTARVDQVAQAMRGVEAGGYGGNSEAFMQALHAAVMDLNWDLKADVTRALVIIGDPPQALGKTTQDPWGEIPILTRDRGIAIHVITRGKVDPSDAGFLGWSLAVPSGGSHAPLTFLHNLGGRQGLVLEAGGRQYMMTPAGRAAGEENWLAGVDFLLAAGAVEPAREVDIRPAVSTHHNLDALLARMARGHLEDRGVTYPQDEELPVLSRFEGTYSAPVPAGDHVIRDRASWASLWRRLHSIRHPVPEVPEVDFGRCMVLATMAGEKRTGGHTIRIQSVTRDRAGLRVHKWSTQPPPDAMVTMALTYPYSIIVVPRQEGPVNWVQAGSPPRREPPLGGKLTAPGDGVAPPGNELPTEDR